MKLALLFSFVLIVNLLSAQVNNTSPEPGCVYDKGPFYLVFEDQFNGTEIDKQAWDVKHGHLRGYDIEMQMYQPQNIEVSNGSMKIWAKKDSATGPCTSGVRQGIAWNEPITKAYTSGEINSKQNFLYGKFEARIKCPYGKQFWPAFWLYAGGGDKKNYCEIDILEAWGTSHANCTVHDYSGAASPHTMRPVVYQKFEFDTWHIFSSTWTPYKIQFMLDNELVTEVYRFSKKKKGVECNEISLPDSSLEEQIWPYPTPSKIILNFALFKNLPGNVDEFLPAAYEVDYVKVWQRIPAFELTGPDSIAMNNTGLQNYSVPLVEGANYLWDYPQTWSGNSTANQLTVSPDSLKGGNLSVVLMFKDGQQIVKDVNVRR